MLSSYYTVKKESTHELIIQNSRFLAHVKRVEDEKDAQDYIDKINKEHWKANHNCYAYVIGENQNIQKASDDGEPSGTAGVPILEVLKKKDLRDTLVVVTRYFGGIKLGAGGLIRAYSKATSEGIQASGIVERRLMTIVQTTLDYTLLGHIENELRQSDYQIKSIDYTDHVTIQTYVPDHLLEEFISWMTDKSSGQATITNGEKEYLESDLNNM